MRGFNINNRSGFTMQAFINCDCPGNVVAFCGHNYAHCIASFGRNLKPCRNSRWFNHNNCRLHNMKFAFNFWSGTCGIEWRNNCTNANSREVRHHEVSAISAEQRNNIAFANTVTGKRATHAGNLLTQCAVCGDSTSRNQRFCVIRMSVNDVGKIHEGRPISSSAS